ISQNFKNFTYIETSKTNFPDVAPEITDIKTYDDGTVLIRVVRQDPSVKDRFCVEQMLSLRVIHLNGAVAEININNTALNMNSLNYCPFKSGFPDSNVNLIRIFPLQEGYILVCYREIADSSDFVTYEDWGIIIHWKLLILSNDVIKLKTSEHVVSYAAISTIEEGYGIIYSTEFLFDITEINPLAPKKVIYAMFLLPNQNQTASPYILYETPLDSVTIVRTFCDQTPVDISQTCIFGLQTNGETYYQSVSFLSSGAVVNVSTGLMIDDYIENNITRVKARIMPSGGYIFILSESDSSSIYAFNENQTLIQKLTVITNQFGANDITNNNTLLLGLPGKNSSWNLYTYLLPKAFYYLGNSYDNLEINSTSPAINEFVEPFTAINVSITFNDPVYLSNASVSIYHSSTGNLRQKVSGILNNFCSVSPDLRTVTVKPDNDSERSVSGVFSDLNTMIINKKITNIFMGFATNDLDSSYGFRVNPNLWEAYEVKLIGAFLAVTLYALIVILTPKRDPGVRF
ncbi:1008_t:CDS:2, partial [Acaulospora colombiana]